MDILKKIAFVLVIIGALNWGLVGLLGLDLVAFMFGPMSIVSSIVYILVGISAIIIAFCGGGFCKRDENNSKTK